MIQTLFERQVAELKKTQENLEALRPQIAAMVTGGDSQNATIVDALSGVAYANSQAIQSTSRLIFGIEEGGTSSDVSVGTVGDTSGK